MATKRYLAFDIETAKILPEAVADLKAYRPLGITCAATLSSDGREYFTWHSQNERGVPCAQMQPHRLGDLVNYLRRKVDQGYTILTWNGLGFDFDILAEESGLIEPCAQLAWHHVDAMFHFFCLKGFRISQEAASQGMKLPGKLSGITGSSAPQLWAAGEHQRVLEYVSQDVRALLQLVEACEADGQVRWITRKGTPSEVPLPSGFVTVQEAYTLPEPDTSWMENPTPRSDFVQWMPRSGKLIPSFAGSS